MNGGPMYYLSRGGGGLGREGARRRSSRSSPPSPPSASATWCSPTPSPTRCASSFGIDPTWTGLVIAVLAGAVILGGIKSIGRFTGFFVPMMIVVYMLGALVVLAINWRGIPDIFVYVIQDAFSPAAPPAASPAPR
jgi:alanine or glycine:cation symporter, AGCS family